MTILNTSCYHLLYLGVDGMHVRLKRKLTTTKSDEVATQLLCINKVKKSNVHDGLVKG